MSRFVDILERKEYSDLCRFSKEDLQYFTKYLFQVQKNVIKWKGNGLMKTNFTQTMYLQLLQELRPKTIIEFGTWQGGSAQWLFDMSKAIGFTPTVHTFANIDEIVTPLSEEIQFHIMDNYKVSEYVIPFKTLEHPILMIEDSHRNCLELLNKFKHFLLPGDYLILEDTHYSLFDYECKYDDTIKNFIHDNNFMVDCKYCDMFGYNMTDCVNSILKKF